MAAQKGIGKLIQVGVAKEATRGTAQSSATYWTPWTDLTLDEKKDFASDEQSYGVIEDSTNLTQIKKWAQGSLMGNVLDQSFGLVLYSMFGTLTSHAAHSGETIVYDNVFNVAKSAQHQSLTLFLHDPLSAVDYSYANGVIEKLEIDLALKKFISYNASIKALSGASQSTFSPATTSENRFVPQYLTAKFATTYAGLQGTLTETGNTTNTSTSVTTLNGSGTSVLQVGMTVSGTGIPTGTTIAAIVSATAITLSKPATATNAGTTLTFGPATVALKAAKLTINANIEDQEVLGNVAPADFLNKTFTVEGTMEAIWQNESDFKTAFMGPTSQAIRLDIKNTDVTIGAAANPEIIFDMPKCTIQELGRPFKVKDLVYQTIKFKAVYSTSDTLMLKATLTNIVNGF